MSNLTGEALLESKIPIQLGELTTDLEYLDERYLSERFLYEGICLKLSNTLRQRGSEKLYRSRLYSGSVAARTAFNPKRLTDPMRATLRGGDFATTSLSYAL